MDYIVTQMIPEFYEKSFKNQSNMTKIIMESAWESKLFDKHDKMQLRMSEFAVPFDILKNAVKQLKGCKPSLEEMYNFFNNNRDANFRMQLSKLQNATIVLSDVHEISNISYTYIAETFPNTLSNAVNDILDGKKSFEEVYENYCGPAAEADYRRRFYSSSEPIGISLKRLCDYSATYSYPITGATISDTVVAMLIELLDVKLAGKDKGSLQMKSASFDNIIKQTQTSFERLFTQLDNIQNAMKKVAGLSSSKVNEKDCYLLFSAVYVMAYNIETRLVTMLLRMVRAYVRNIKEISSLYDLMLIKDGLSSPAYGMMEDCEEDYSADGHNPALTSSSSLRSAIDDTIISIINHKGYDESDMWEVTHKMTEENPHLVKVIGRNTMVDTGMYDKVINGVATYENKINNLIDIVTGNGGEENASWVDFDHALQLAGLPDVNHDDNIFKSLWTGLSAESSIYINPQSGLILTDLQLMKRNIADVSSRLHRMAITLKENYDRLEANPNGMYKADINRLANWFGIAFDNLSELDTMLHKAYRLRLIELARLFLPYNWTMPSYYDRPVEVDRAELPRYTYGGDDGESEVIEYYEESANAEISSMHHKYQDMYRKKLRGEMFYEADEVKTGDTNNTQQPADKPTGNAGGTGNNQDNKAPAVKVNDGGATAEEQQKQSANVNSVKLSVKLRGLMSKVINLVKQVFERGDKAKNTKFLNDNKGFLLSRSYTNTSVEVLPYRKDSGPVKLLTESISRAVSIDPVTLKTTNEDGLRNAVYSAAKIPTTGNGIEADLIQGFKVGTTKYANITVADNELKGLVPSMIKYCENYYATIEADLDKANEDMKGLSKFDTLKNANDSDKTEDNVKVLNNMLSAGIRAARTASRDKCNNYMTVLSSLASSNKKSNGAVPAQDNTEAKPATTGN